MLRFRAEVRQISLKTELFLQSRPLKQRGPTLLILRAVDGRPAFLYTGG